MVSLQQYVIELSQNFSISQPIVLALVTSLTIIAVLYLIATLFRNQGLINYIKLEIYEIIFAMIIVIFINLIMAQMINMDVSSIFPSYSGQASIGIYDASEKYFYDASKAIARLIDVNYIANLKADFTASITTYMRPMGAGLTTSPYTGYFSPIKQLLYNVISALGVAFMLNMAQLYIFQFAVIAFLEYFLALGVFLRCFTPTRRLGGSLIAIGMGFLFFFPLMTLMSYEIAFGRYSPMPNMISELDRAYVQGLFSDTQPQQCTDQQNNPIPCPTRNVVQAAGFGGILESIRDNTSKFFNNALSVFTFLPRYAFTAMFFLPISAVGIVFVAGYVLPAVSTLLFIQFVKSLSAIIGEEVDISSLTRLI